jgi:hypothetical protein
VSHAGNLSLPGDARELQRGSHRAVMASLIARTSLFPMRFVACKLTRAAN